MKYLWDEKGRALRQAVDLAHAAYRRAAETSKEILADFPSRLPDPDGTQRIRNAASAERHALDEYMKALRAFNDYATKSRRIPDG